MLNRIKLLFPICTVFFLVQIAKAEIRFSTSSVQEPKMQFEQTTHDFGRVWQGTKVTHKFKFTNVGNADLEIGAMKPTCGCTAAVASTGPFRPGESGEIELHYDSRGKVGFASKDVKVYSNDPQSPYTLILEGLVIPESHPSKTTGDVLFNGSCAECHSIPAKGKKGQELYVSVCFICHDFPQNTGKGAIAAELKALSQMSKKDLKRAISKGLPNSSMPGFSHRSGGPLSKDQIDSIIEFLHSIKTKE